MLRLFSFLSQFRNVLLFVGLELFALILIVRVNNHQRHIVGDAMLDVTNGMQDFEGGITDYLYLREKNIALANEKAALERQVHRMRQQMALLDSQIEKDSITRMQIDTSRTDSFEYIPALVIKNTTHRSYNYLTVNKGKADGVVPGIGVVATSGIVGRVIEVADKYSLVQSALNVDFRVSLTAIEPGRDQTIGSIGFYAWNGMSRDQAQLTYIPETVDLDTGYVVVTAGNSTIFPPGYNVGTISSRKRDQSDGFYELEMDLKTDFNQLRYVYLIKPNNKEIIDSLEINYPIE